MKQTSLPPTIQKQQQQHMQKKTPQKLNGFQQGSPAGRQPPPPSPAHTHTLPNLPFFLFFYATSKTFEWHFAGGPIVCCSTLCAGWDRVCPCLVPPSSSFALIRFLRFCKTLVRKMHIIIHYTTKHLMRCCYYRLIMRGSRNFVRRSPTKL